MDHMTLRKLHLRKEYIDISNVCDKKKLMICHEIKTELDQWSPYQNSKKKKKKESKENTIMIENYKPRLNLRKK